MLILASASPRRRELLTQIGIEHRISPADIDETRHIGEKALEYVRRLAIEKAQVVQARYPQNMVLAADTTVALDGVVMNKPADLAKAEAMLRALAGRTHQVHTGIAIANGAQLYAHVETTRVSFSEIAEWDLQAYLATGDSLDKAGAYGIQGYAARWISRIEGDFFNVMGLPLAATVRLLREAELGGVPGTRAVKSFH